MTNIAELMELPSSKAFQESTRWNNSSPTLALDHGDSCPTIQPLNWFQRFARKRVLDWLSRLQFGQISLSGIGLTNPLDELVFGSDSMRCRWNILSSSCYSSLATRGAMGLAESYMQGQWQSDDLLNLLRILYRNGEESSRFHALIADTTQFAMRILERIQGNSIVRSRKQISKHYDLSNEFFELFLDRTLMYSSAFFERRNMTLEQASVAKLEQICRKLDLQEGESVLEIGTGWGGFGLHAVGNYGIQLTTTTISDAQFSKARARFANAKMLDQINLLSKDYRLLEGEYDKLVSIEMIEAVGEKNLDTYFRQCGRLLRPGGRMVIQAIVMPEQRYAKYRRSFDFIQKYIFPGGFLPSISAMQQAVGRTTDLRMQSIEDITPHYARTLLEWRHNFMSRLADVRLMGFDDQFVRMWEYYLCYCEAAFLEQAVQVVQIVWDRPKV
jgi:cyclopropane-fatty-acyl-phospholipid synthase